MGALPPAPPPHALRQMPARTAAIPSAGMWRTDKGDTWQRYQVSEGAVIVEFGGYSSGARLSTVVPRPRISSNMRRRLAAIARPERNEMFFRIGCDVVIGQRAGGCDVTDLPAKF